MLRCYQRDIARFIHAQMQEHYWEEAVGYEVKISKGFTELKPSAYTASAAEPPLDFRQSPADKSNMAKYLFGGFKRCLYPVQKFQSDAERKLAVILEREAMNGSSPPRAVPDLLQAARTIWNTSPTSSPRPTTRSTCWSRKRRTDGGRRVLAKKERP